MTVIETLRTRTDLMSSTEVAYVIGVHKKTLLHWVNSGRIPVTRVGRSYRYDPQHIADWLEQRSY